MTKNPIPKFLTQSEKEALYTAAQDPRDRLIFSLGLNAGMRVSEIINLKTEDIDWENSQIRFIAKGGKERLIPMNLRLKIDLTIALENRPLELQHNFLIQNKRNIKTGVSRFAPDKLIRRYRKKAGIQRHLHMHMLRHTAATDFYRSCGDIYQTQRFLGHRRIDTTTRYAQIDDKEIEMTLSHINCPHWFTRLVAQFRSFPPEWLIHRGIESRTFYAGGTVDRQKELAVLQQNIERHTTTVVLSERGGGKSHLLHQLSGENIYSLDSFRPPRESLVNLCEQLKEKGLIDEIPKGRGTSTFIKVLRQVGREHGLILVINDLSTITADGVIAIRKFKDDWTIIAGLDIRYKHRATEIFFGSHKFLELLPLTKVESSQLAEDASQDLELPDKASFIADVVNEARGNPQAVLDLVEHARRTQESSVEHPGLQKTLPATPFLTLFLLWACIGRYTASSLGHPDIKVLFALVIIILSITIVFDRILVKGEKL